MTGSIDPMRSMGQEIDRRVHAALNTAGKKIVKDAVDAAKAIVHPAAVKGETSGIKTEAVGASLGFKLFNAEKTVFDLQEILDKRRGLDPDSLKREIATVRGVAERATRIAEQATVTLRNTRQSLGRVTGRALGQATRANRRLDALRTEIRRSAPQQQAHIGNTRSFSEAAERINRLEQRISSLTRALD
ncbi:hypothetical protein [Streptomyces sp. S465]|uniref:hypothetical protein n=1 Tax=Streptomyces sp. S465 TaxID=2979468 RepID=UPI0022A8930D|nr:hypothetical protein [Streptomyces sp. S465]WAP59826.1 hypothetical protein N6H00_35475 [Streptomyces sp. S465]